MIKRIFDIIISFFGLLAFAPFLIILLFLVWLQDLHSPIYVAYRMKKSNEKFKMYKLRSMVHKAETIGGVSTSGTDNRITRLGHIIRRFKFDEMLQLWNVLIGDMSLVGPRPQTDIGGTSLYTNAENKLFNARPGITDIASIVFSDEGDILAGSSNPDLKYNQVIRPWKSRLGLFYISNANFLLDLNIIYLTCVSIVSRETALNGVRKILCKFHAKEELINIVRRNCELVPFPPPGMDRVEKRY